MADKNPKAVNDAMNVNNPYAKEVKRILKIWNQKLKKFKKSKTNVKMANKKTCCARKTMKTKTKILTKNNSKSENHDQASTSNSFNSANYSFKPACCKKCCFCERCVKFQAHLEKLKSICLAGIPDYKPLKVY